MSQKYIGKHVGCGGGVYHSDEIHAYLNQGNCRKCGKEVIIDPSKFPDAYGDW